MAYPVWGYFIKAAKFLQFLFGFLRVKFGNKYLFPKLPKKNNIPAPPKCYLVLNQ